MKKILVMFAALIMISGVTFAGEAPLLSTADMSVSLVDQVVKVRYRSDKAGKVKVSIYCNATGKEVFSEQIKRQANFIRPYNLSGLPYGEYSIVLEDEAGRAVERVNYSKKVVTVLSSIIELKSKDGVVVTLFSKEATDVTVRLFNKAGEILLSKQTSINGQNSQAFNLKEIKGAVKIEVLNSENEILQSKTVLEQVL